MMRYDVVWHVGKACQVTHELLLWVDIDTVDPREVEAILEKEGFDLGKSETQRYQPDLTVMRQVIDQHDLNFPAKLQEYVTETLPSFRYTVWHTDITHTPNEGVWRIRTILKYERRGTYPLTIIRKIISSIGFPSSIEFFKNSVEFDHVRTERSLR